MAGTGVSTAPSISTQPASQTVTAGQTATFSVSGSGAAPLSYQWRKNGAAISGANSASYTTPATSTSDSGSQFTVVVSNSAGNVTSNVATLTVTAADVAPSITTQPVNQMVTVGQTATFSVTASGTSPLNYQWRKNGTTINGATSPSYITPATAISDSGSAFTIAISNSMGNVTSNTATLTVSATPVAITVNPNTAVVMAGSTQKFAGTVTGTSNTAITWTVSGVGCAGVACGTISTNGQFVAPASVPSPAAIIVKATSVADPTKSASANVTIVAAVAVLLSISPTSASVPTSGTQLFTASVTGTSNTAVTWGVSSAGCSSSPCGTISTSGSSAVYLAPSVAPSPASVTVVATSVADPTKTASTSVTVVPVIAVTVSPTGASVPTGTTQQFKASVTGTSNTAVAWSVTGTGCSGVACGTINTSGFYTAPAVVPSPATVTVTATSVADPTKSSAVNLTIVGSGKNGSAQALAITTTALPQIVKGQAYSALLQAAGGTPPYTWIVASGQLPSGLTLSAATGQIQGMPPSSAGQFSFTVQVADSAARPLTAAKAFNLSITANSAPTASTCMVGGFSYNCDAYGGVTGTNIPCNGTGSAVIGTVGYFHAELVGNRWWLCTPSNNLWWELSVYVMSDTNLSGSASNNFANTVTSKYAGNYATWANNVTKRIQQEGFNAIGPYAGLGSHNMYPIGSYGNSGNSTALPFVYHTDEAADCMLAAAYKIKNVYNGLLSPVTRDFPDVFDPNYQTCYTADLTATGSFFVGGNNSRMGVFNPPFTDSQKYLESVWLGDSDYLYGMTASNATPDHGGGGPQLGLEYAIASPTQATGPNGDLGNHWSFSDTTFHGKSEWLAWVQGTAETHSSVSCTRSGSAVTCALGDSEFGPSDVLTTSSCTDSTFNSIAGTGVTVASLTSSTLTFTLAGSGSSATCTVAAGPGYASINAFNTAWGCRYTTFGSSGGWPKSTTNGTGLSDEDGTSSCFPAVTFSSSFPKGLTGGNATARSDLANFLQRIANKFFQIGRDSIRSVFPNHLVSGPGFFSTKTYDQVLIASMYYVDLPEYWMEPKWAATYLPYAYNLSSVKKPATLWTNLSASGESGLAVSFDSASPTDSASCNISAGVTNYDYASQTLRGQCYKQLMNGYWNAVGNDGNHFVVGERWWQLTDNYSYSINFGLMDQFDNVYDATCPVTGPVIAGDNGFNCGGEVANYNSDFMGAASSSGVGTKTIAGNLIWVLGAQLVGSTGSQ